MRRSNSFLPFVIVALLAAGGGLWFAQATLNQSAPKAPAAPVDQAELRDGPLLRLPQAKVLADFALYDHAGEPFNKASLDGQWTLVFFGFTSCPHICPSVLYKLNEASAALDEGLEKPRVLLISVDPERDTPEVLARYRERFDGKIEAVSGPDAQLRALAMQLGAHYVIPEHEPDEWYNVDHSLNVMVLDADANWVGVYSAPHDIEAIAASLSRFLADSRG